MALAPILTEHLPSCYTPEKNVSAPVDGGDYSVDRNVGSKKEFFFGTLSTTANLLCVGQGSIFVSFSLSLWLVALDRTAAEARRQGPRPTQEIRGDRIQLQSPEARGSIL